jgi:prepilin-type N-terminal cleavage/methylation domain-containing protein
VTDRAPGVPLDRPCGGRRATRAFTLVELMVVMAILGMLLVLLPPRLDAWGDRGKLDSTASTLVSALTGAREMAVIDGHETRVQFDLPGETKDRKKTGRFRFLVTSLDRPKSKALDDPAVRTLESEREREMERRAEAVDEWVITEWRQLPEGVVLAGFSVESGQWIRSNPRGDPVEVSFDPDGTVRPACALRLESVDLPKGAENTVTVVVNPLTSIAEVVDGAAELAKSRDPSEFR